MGNQTAIIVDHIVRSIETGRLNPGDVIEEKALVSEFGVSRTPVREALLQLDSLGILKRKPRGGAEVFRPTLEEFLAILPQSSMPVARGVAERLCQAMEDAPILLQSGEELRITVSIGVAVAGAAGDDSYAIEGLVEQADLALLESKGAGRNQVTYRMAAA